MDSEHQRISVGVYGATGYMGGEVLRVLLEHPNVDVRWITSRSEGDIEEFHPNLFGLGLKLSDPNKLARVDLVFVGLPFAATFDCVERFLQAGSRVIDMSAAFRLKNLKIWEEVYRMRHPLPLRVEEAIYGVTELRESAIRQARLVAMPGCYSSAVILSLAPLVSAGLIDTSAIVTTGLSGTIGAGAELHKAAHHPEIGGNIVPYNATGHRHISEMEQELSAISGDRVHVRFTPIYVPIVRGLLTVSYLKLRSAKTSAETVRRVLKEAYHTSPFIHIMTKERSPDASWDYAPYPWVSAIAGTNYCLLAVEAQSNQNELTVFAALDSVGKGGAHVAVECMNLMFGLPRNAGLSSRALHP